MAVDSVAVPVAPSLYRRFERLAALTHRPVDSLIEQALSAAIPPLPEDVPAEMRHALAALEAFEDALLWQVLRSVVAPEQQEELEELQDKQRSSALSKAEAERLAALHHVADELMLRKAYAAVLLKWRGHRLPTLADLEANG